MTILTLRGKQEMLIQQRGATLECYRVADATDVDVVADVLIADGALTLVTTQFPSPLKLQFNVTDTNSSITALDAAIVGTDEDGVAATESVSLDNSGSGGTISVTTSNFYSKLTSITLSNATGNSTGDNVKVGTALLGAQDYNTVMTGLWNETALATGDWIKTPRSVKSVIVTGLGDAATDASGVLIEQSMDASTVHETFILTDEDGARTVSASTRVSRFVPITMEYWRFRWQNGAADQGVFDAHVYMSADPVVFDQLLVVSGTSGSGADQTVTVPTSDQKRVVHRVAFKYSGAATVAVLVTLNSGLGAAFDTLLTSISLTAETMGSSSYNDRELTIGPDDALDVLLPLVTSQTSSVTIYSSERK